MITKTLKTSGHLYGYLHNAQEPVNQMCRWAMVVHDQWDSAPLNTVAEFKWPGTEFVLRVQRI
jgi:hypothetical protein